MTEPGRSSNGADPAGSFGVFARFALHYAAAFGSLGVFMQFFPVWLHDARGLDPDATAFVLSGQIWARTFAGPFWAQRVDRTGDPRRLLLRLVLASLGVMLLFGAVHERYGLFCCSALFGCCYSPQYAILDGYALHASHRHSFSYTRCRSWGSLSFLLVIAALGYTLRQDWSGQGPVASAPWIRGALLLGLLATCGTAWALPDSSRPGGGMPVDSGARAPIWVLLRQPAFLLFLLATGMIGGSHAAYYSLSTVHWRHHGIGEDVASLLWGEGVVAEIVLFASLRSMGTRLRPTTWILIGAIGAALRWAVLGWTTDPRLLFAVNWLHGVSFGCTFLGSLQFIRLRVGAAHQATAQGLLGAVSAGICTAVCTQLAGKAYMAIEGATFYAMSGVAVLGAVLTMALRSRRHVQLD